MTHWTKLRDNFRKCLNRRKIATRSGSANKQLPTCLYFKELSFLTDVIGVRTTSSNINPSLFTPPPSPSPSPSLASSEKNLEQQMIYSVSPPPLANRHYTTSTSSSASSPINDIGDIGESNSSYLSTSYTTKSSTKPAKRKPTDTIDMLLAKALMDDVSAKKENSSGSTFTFLQKFDLIVNEIKLQGRTSYCS